MPIARRPLALLAAVAALAVAGCGSGGAGTSADGGAVDVVATTTVVGDIARNVGGERVRVEQLLQPNSDPHDYEPRPGDVVATAKARFVLASGDGLDDWIGDVVEQSGGEAEVVDLAAALPVRRDDAAADDEHTVGDGHDHGPGDPHWWHDPANVVVAANAVRDALSAADPGGGARYAANAAAYVRKVRALDAAIASCLAAVPAERRKLVTDHDALGWFADRYDVEIVGAVIPARTTQAQPSAGDVAELARVIEREGVRAVFPESGSAAKLPEALARQTGVTAAYHLYGDALGPEGSGADTYLGMAAANADAMVRGFTGGRRGCAIAGR